MLRSRRFDLQTPYEQTEGFARILFFLFHVKRATKIFFGWVRPALPRKLMDSGASNSTSEKRFLIHCVFPKVISTPNFVMTWSSASDLSAKFSHFPSNFAMSSKQIISQIFVVVFSYLSCVRYLICRISYLICQIFRILRFLRVTGGNLPAPAGNSHEVFIVGVQVDFFKPRDVSFYPVPNTLTKVTICCLWSQWWTLQIWLQVFLPAIVRIFFSCVCSYFCLRLAGVLTCDSSVFACKLHTFLPAEAGNFSCRTHTNLPATSMQNYLLLQAKMYAICRQKHWNRR